MATLKKAIDIATQAHKGVVDKYGAPYIEHIKRVISAGETNDEKIVGALHDVVEDTEWTFDQLLAEGFSNEVIEALKCVTKINEDEDYEAFIDRVAENPLAIRVKLNDLADNLTITRMDKVRRKDLKRLNKYLKAYKKLKAII